LPNKQYEMVFITEPEKSEDQQKEITESIKNHIKNAGGNVETVEQWGKKRLAYTVKKQRYGYYTLFHFTAEADTIAELELSLKHNESILKWIMLNRHPQSVTKPPVGETVSQSYYDNDR